MTRLFSEIHICNTDHMRHSTDSTAPSQRLARTTAIGIAVAALIGALLPTAAAAETPAPTATASPEPTASADPAASPEPTVAPDPAVSSGPEPTAEPEPTAAPTPSEQPADEELTPEQMDRLARDTTVDAAVVEEGADEVFRTMSLVGFNPGNIIGDAVFFNSGTMSAAQIQAFFDGKVRSCQSGYTCLKDYRQATPTRTADRFCPSTYTGARNESAATIVYKVARACGINPQALIVMLQKEQGLVTHTWPSEFRYTIAMGMACPDTAACDERYFGFFNQVYGAARQLKVYGMDSFFNWYPVGATSNVRWHPNASCGSAPVYIANKATAALYYYTPYQPNRAALNAGYGEGDGCSSYGNRNFYNYFTDWFGPTNATPSMIKDGDHVYLVTRSGKYHITRETLAEYQRVFGTPTPVSSAYAARFPTHGQATHYIRNAQTGEVALLQDGQRHRFPTCGDVQTWGSRCGTETTLSPVEFNRVPVGAEITRFARTSSTPFVQMISGTTLYPLYSPASVAAFNDGKTPYAAMMPDAAATRFEQSFVRWAPGRYIEPSGETRTYLPQWDGRLIYLPTWLYSYELGLGKVRDDGVATGTLSGYRKGETLNQFVRCGSTIYLPSRGTLYPVTASAVSGFGVTNLDAQLCARLKTSAASAMGQVFVQGVGKDDVYVAEDGRWRHIVSRAAMEAFNGGVFPQTHRLAADLVDWLPKGPPISDTIPPTGSVLQVRGNDPVYMADGKRGWHIPSWDVGSELGLRAKLKVLPNHTVLSRLRIESRPIAPVISCSDGYFVASQGKLHKISLAGLGGLPGRGMPLATCRSFDRSGVAVNGRLFVKVGATTYVAENGTMRPLRSGETTTALNGGRTATVLIWNAGTLSFVRGGSR